MNRPLWEGVKQFSGESYERCMFVPITAHRHCPDYVFIVQTERGNGGPLVLKLELAILPDAELREFVRSHPQWRKDPRPLLLFCIQDFFWRLKLITVSEEHPFTLSGGVVDSHSGGVLHLRLRVTRMETGNDETIVPLVNYANTHIYDQLEAVYRQNPSAAWTRKRAEQVKKTFYRTLEEKKHVTARERKQRHSAWRKSGEQWHYFLDESGELGFRNTSDVFMSVGVGVRSDKAAPLRQELVEILDSAWGKQKPTELHFNKLPETKREVVLRSVAEAFRRHDADGICYMMQKENLLLHALRCEAESRRRDERPIITTLQHFLTDPNLHPQAFFVAMCLEEMATLIGVRCMLRGNDWTLTHDRKRWDWQNEALERGFKNSGRALAEIANDHYGQQVDIRTAFSVAESQKEPCIWVADWIGWELSRWVKNENISPGLADCFCEMNIICFDDHGQPVRIDHPGGRVLERFPDWPREFPRTSGTEVPEPLKRDEKLLPPLPANQRGHPHP